MNKQITIISLLLLIGFASAAYKCLEGTNGCSACDATKLACTGCKAGWYLDSTLKQCKQCATSNGCATCSDASKCTAPLPGYALAPDGALGKCADGCAVCTKTAGQSDTTCTTPASGFYFKTGTTPSPCAKGCDTCKGDNTADCQQPLAGWFFDVGLGTCIVKNCFICAAVRKTCNQCKDGFITNLANNTCDECMLNCVSCTTKLDCAQCKTGYVFSAADKQCQQCTVDSCATCSDTKTCSTCISGYSLSNSICIKCAEYCNSCTVAGQCSPTGCAFGYSYNSQTFNCGKTCSGNCQAGCVEKGFNNCDSCDATFGWKNAAIGDYSCAACGNYCKAGTNCDDFGATKCDECLPGYGLITTTTVSTYHTCVSCGAGCITCSVTSGTTQLIDCETCSTGYVKVVLANSVNSCVSCTQNLQYNQQTTTNTDINAKSCTYSAPPKVVVTACKDGYYLYMGICYSCTAATPVQLYSATNTEVSKANSEQFQAKALVCSFQFVKITACAETYVLFNNKCVSCKSQTGVTGTDTNALTCTTTNGIKVVVKSCKPKYALWASTGVCVSCTASTVTGYMAGALTCTATSATSVTVTDCDTGYAFWSSGNKCLSCTATSSGADGGAATCTATSLTAVTVTSCATGKALKSTGACLTCLTQTSSNAGSDGQADTCTTDDTNITVTKCNSKYVLLASGKCIKCTETTSITPSGGAAANNVGFDTNALSCTADTLGQNLTVTACVDTFALASNGKCYSCTETTQYTPSGGAATDNTGFDTNAKSCSTTDNGVTMVVDACIDGFGLFGGKCYSCTETSTGFDTNASACDATAAATVTVTACKSGYALFNGTCKSCIATNPGFDLNTKTCSWAPVVIVGGVANTVYPVTVAGACAAGYYLKFNQCIQCSAAQTVNTVATTNYVPYCASCTVNDTYAITCLSCIDGYTMSNAICVQCDVNCTVGTTCSQAGAGKCDAGNCADGFGITSSTVSTCSACTANCIHCSTAGAGFCDTDGCANSKGFYLTQTGNLCTACALNCQFCSIGGQCSKCLDGYWLNGVICTACYDTKKCTCISSSSLIDCSPIPGWGKYFSTGTALTATNSIVGTIDTCVSNLCLLCFGKTAEECLVYADRTYYDSVAKTINPCPTGCNKCTGNTPDKCSDAQPGWVKLLVNNTASLAPCPAGCAGCTASGANITCTSCPTDVLGGSVKEVNATVFTCTFNCVAGCQNCTTQDNAGCSSCKTGYKKDSSNACVSVTATTTPSNTSTTSANAQLISTLVVAILVALFLLF